jgi:hypothetical protein
MISGVFAFCSAKRSPSVWRRCWPGGEFVINAIYIPLMEEPGLERRFGSTALYKKNVPRWIRSDAVADAG